MSNGLVEESGAAIQSSGVVEAAERQISSPDFRVLRQVPMTVQVEVGRATMTLGEILDGVDAGTSIRLDRHAGEPVEVYVNGSLFARAEVVVVQDQIAARIVELVDPDDPLRPSSLRGQ
jgi:flagellar motor switch protein FliN/FliY